jgi:16S rRNA (guanine966-N2)-methyltransferase
MKTNDKKTYKNAGFFLRQRELARRRLWPIALTFLSHLIFNVVSTETVLNDTLERATINHLNASETTRSLQSALQSFLGKDNLSWILLTLPLAAMLAIEGFSWMHKRREVDFFESLPVPRGQRFLDICAGSGGIGIEAISRGAKRAYFIENGRAAISCIQQNLHKTGFEEQAVILRQDAVAALRQVHEKEVDLVYLDPPYKSDLARRILIALDGQSYITEDSCIIVETDNDSDFSFLDDTGLEIFREKNYRGNRHLFIRRK